MSDVARAASVSIGTVSNVLNHPQKVRPATVERVRQAIAELGFVRNANASALAAGASRVIGLVVIDLSNSMFVDVAIGAQGAARTAGLNLLLAGSEDDHELQRQNVEFFDEARVSGLLLAPMQDSTSHIRFLAEHARPTVVLNYDAGSADMCTVIVDNEHVGYLAVTHLCDVDCRHVVFLGGGDHLQPVCRRREGVRRAAIDTGIRLEEVSTPDLSHGAARQVARSIVRRPPGTRPDGVIGVTDVIASAVLEEALDAGLRVPEDLAVMGCDHNTAAWGGAVPLSTVTMCGKEMGAAGTRLLVDSVSGYHVGGTINIDTGDGGERLESRVITEIGTGGPEGTGISFTPGLDAAHAAGSIVTGSGDNVADVDPAAGAAVSPRFIGRIELEYADGSQDTIVTDRSWLTATGGLVTNAWYSGADFDDRRVQVGWNEPGADHTASAVRRDGSPMDWGPAGVAPPPNLATQLVARTAEVIKVVHEWEPMEITNPREGTWVFDFGQNMAGIPELRLTDPLPAGTTIRLTPAESLNADGTVNQASFGVGGRGTDVFNTYTTSGRPNETWHSDFNYLSMQWIQLDGLPADFTPDENTVRGLQVMADVERPGSVVTSNERVNRIERMSRYSVLSNVQSVITDTPGREKLSYPADYTQPIGFIHRQVDLRSFFHTTMRHLGESQSVDDTYMRGNIPLKAPVYDWGYTRRFGDEINWGNSIILVPWLHYELYGDTTLMEEFYPQMVHFVEYIQREKVGTGEDEHIVDAALADWVSAQQTSGEITGTWGYHYMIDRMARMTELIGADHHSELYGDLAEGIRDAFNERFYNEELGRYTFVSDGEVVDTQAAQALPLEAGIVEEENRESVEAALAELVREFGPEGDGPHFSAGTIGMQPVVRALMAAGEDDLLWEVLQQDTYPSMGYFMAPTVENPNGMTTVGERWTRRDSKNHMILAQADEWFHAGLAGIRQAPGSVAYRDVVIEPTVVGDLTFVDGSYRSPSGEIVSSWERDADSFRLDVVVPGNTRAEVRVPLDVVDGDPVASFGLEPDAVEDGHAVYHVGSGWWNFGVGIDLSPLGSLSTLADALDGYVASGDVAGPIAGQLTNALEQAQRHLEGERATPAARALERFARHLDNPKWPDTLSDEALADLYRQVDVIRYRIG